MKVNKEFIDKNFSTIHLCFLQTIVFRQSFINHNLGGAVDSCIIQIVCWHHLTSLLNDNLKNDSYYKFYGISKVNDYLNLFKNSTDEKYLMDSSVSYFTDEEAPKKIFKFNSKSKIIIMFRDPVKRALSHHSMDFRMGLANNSLSKYLLDSRLKKFYVQYVHNSMYYKYSKNYIDALRFIIPDS